MDIQSSLARLGYSSISLVSTGEEALEAFQGEKPDLVLMDILLKGARDGIETAGIIRDLHDTPVIYITAYADDATLQRAKLTGPYGYILKPFHERELHTAIEMALYKHKIENELRDNEERYRRFFNEDLTGDVIAGLDGGITDCNAAFARIFGYSSAEEARGRNLSSLFPDDGSWKEFAGELLQEKKITYLESELRRSDGKQVYVVANFLVLPDKKGAPSEILGYIFDDTNRKRLEQQLLQAQKMEAIGRLAGAIAHDFNNLLTVITGYSDFLLSKLGHSEMFRGEIREIKLAGERASLLTHQLLAFSRSQVLQPKIVDLNEIVAGMETLLRRLIGENIELKAIKGEKLWPVRVDPGQMEQVIMNLAVNARDAMPDGGKLALETANAEIDEGASQQHLDMKPGFYVTLAVSDNGAGMSDEVKQHLFEPFFTTKARGKGTGLGLSTVYGIITQSNGHIHVYSEPGAGTSIRIYLPRSSRRAAEDGVKEREMQVKKGTETVLVAEDEDMVRTLVSRLLRMSGYTVLEAQDGEEAMRIAGAHEGAIHLLIADMVMPGMSGPELAAGMSSLRPETRVLYMSGYTDTSVLENVDLDKRSSFIPKPFNPEALSMKVREVLDEGKDIHP